MFLIPNYVLACKKNRFLYYYLKVKLHILTSLSLCCGFPEVFVASDAALFGGGHPVLWGHRTCCLYFTCHRWYFRRALHEARALGAVGGGDTTTGERCTSSCFLRSYLHPLNPVLRGAPLVIRTRKGAVVRSPLNVRLRSNINIRHNVICWTYYILTQFKCPFIHLNADANVRHLQSGKATTSAGQDP